MASSPRSKPTSSGPGRGTPRSRTTARPGERARPRTLSPTAEPDETETTQSAAGPPQRNRAISITWRLLVVAVVAAAIAVSLAQSLRVYFAQADEIAELRAEIQARHDEIADLEDQINRWQDPDYVRAMARERLGWVMPGETGYRVIGVDGEVLGGEHDVLGEDELPGTWWEKMWGSVAVADRPVEDDDADEDAGPDETTPPATVAPSPIPESTDD